MNSTDARRHARITVNEYEARSREVRQKIEYLRQLRLSARVRRAQAEDEEFTDLSKQS
jgi:hypothetical protein